MEKKKNTSNVSVSVEVSLANAEAVKGKLIELIELEEKAKSLAHDLANVDLKLSVNGHQQN